MVAPIISQGKMPIGKSCEFIRWNIVPMAKLTARVRFQSRPGTISKSSSRPPQANTYGMISQRNVWPINGKSAFCQSQIRIGSPCSQSLSILARPP